jgi:hypothetical protein
MFNAVARLKSISHGHQVLAPEVINNGQNPASPLVYQRVRHETEGPALGRAIWQHGCRAFPPNRFLLSGPCI